MSRRTRRLSHQLKRNPEVCQRTLLQSQKERCRQLEWKVSTPSGQQFPIALLYLIYLTRQIRNAFQTAIALAEFHAAESHPSKPTKLKIELGKKHFLTVAQASKDFDEYLQRTLGGQNEADMARNEQTRIDDFDMPKIVRRGQGKKKKVVEDVDSEEDEEDSEDSDAEEGSEDGSEEEVEVVQVVKKVVKKRGR
jgi:hypothetical protein